MRILKRWLKRSVWGIAVALSPWTAGVAEAQASYSVVWNFQQTATNGSVPYHAPMVQASDGKLYGTTIVSPNGPGGTVFSFDPGTGVLTTLYVFPTTTSNGGPVGQLIQAQDGKLYGTTDNGGSNGTGTIFSIDPAIGGTSFQTLYTFPHPGGLDVSGGVPGGWQPEAGLVEGPDHKLYGTAVGGGKFQPYFGNAVGTIFSFDPATGLFSTVHSFGGGPDEQSPGSGTDGWAPQAPLIVGQDGKLYGTAFVSGTWVSGGNGTAFSFDPVNRAFTVLHTFGATADPVLGYGWDGYDPAGPLTQASNGKLYGTTYYGPGSSINAGTVFSIDPANGNTFAVVHSFAVADGGAPNAPLFRAKDGKLYGTTTGYVVGGSFRVAKGTLFTVDPANSDTFALLHTFTGSPGDGDAQSSGLLQISDCTLYGVTSNGGTFDAGVIFKVTGLQGCNPLTVTAGSDQTLTASLTGQATATLTATVSGGTAPYSYQWTFVDGTGDIDDIPRSTLGSTMSVGIGLPLGVFTFKVTVTDANGATASATTNITVQLPTIAGAPGAPGPQGPQGPKGDKGDQGIQGLQGVQGSQGPQGPAGPAGATGAQGPQGPAGPAGATGAQGPQGPAGPAGATGAQGPQGSTGPIGAQGLVGPIGPQGPPGPAISQLWNTFVYSTLNKVLTAGRFTPDGNITVTRIQVQLQTAPVSCTTNAVIRVTDGTTAATLPLTKASNDTAALALNYTAGVPIDVIVSVAASCKTNPQNANVLVQYKGR